MIYAIGDNISVSSQYQFAEFTDFLDWEAVQKEWQLDIETTVTDHWCNKELVTIQFGDIQGTDQWVIRWESLSTAQKEALAYVLQNKSKTKLIHNAMFEYVVLGFRGITLNNVYDTMLAEMVLSGGLAMGEGVPKGYYSLAGIVMRYLCIDLDKSQQMTFTNGQALTEEQIIYAADDVRPIAAVRRMQIDKLKICISGLPLENVAALEMEAVLSYGDMIIEGMGLDTNEWLANLDLVEPIIQSAEKDCIDIMQSDPDLLMKAIELGYVNLEDKSLINWNSPSDKLKLLQILPGEPIQGTAKLLLSKLIRTRHPHSEVLSYMVNGDWQKAGEYFYPKYREEMVEKELIRPAGDVSINWNSVDQVLPLLRAINPRMKSMDEEAMNKLTHPIGEKIKQYKESLKLRSTYGEQFIEKYLEPDGKIRTTINQVVSTGRASSRKPNMQNIPAKEEVGNRYRNCFKAPKDYSYVSGDYISQEICAIAYMSKDPVWTAALIKGQDLHSVCAEMVWPKKWKEAAESDCAYYQIGADGQQLKQKCKCKKHKPIRYDTKAIDFGLAYGMTKFKFAADAKISVAEADSTIRKYFTTFPKIGNLLNFFGSFGVEKGYIQTIWPFYRKRWFPEWHYISKSELKMHLAGIEHSWRAAAIERASKNMPIQGCCGDMAKLSICMIRWFIDDNNLRDKVRQVMQVHDQDDTVAANDYKEEWAGHLQRIMEEAALFIIPSGLVKVDVQITASWSK